MRSTAVASRSNKPSSVTLLRSFSVAIRNPSQSRRATIATSTVSATEQRVLHALIVSGVSASSPLRSQEEYHGLDDAVGRYGLIANNGHSAFLCPKQTSEYE
jgi:hypothetical protein